jgi:hypothetical protein
VDIGHVAQGVLMAAGGIPREPQGQGPQHCW